MVRKIAGIIFCIATLGLVGCGQDAEVGGRDRTPANVMNMPEGWSNIAKKCDGPNMVYGSDHGDSYSSSVTVAPNDPRCKNAETTPQP